MVSRGSVATSLRYGGIYNAHFVENFVLSLAVKEFWKSSICHEVIDMSRVSCFLLTHSVFYLPHTCSIVSIVVFVICKLGWMEASPGRWLKHAIAPLPTQ